MNILEKNFAQGFIRMCNDGSAQGWHERNGGNLSYRLKDEEVELIKDELNYNEEFVEIGTTVKNLADEYLLVTGSGRFFRNIVLKPKENIGIIQIDNSGEKYRIVWGLNKGAKPTSELPSHLMNHEVKKINTNNTHRVIYHCHPANIIALTFVLPLDNKLFTRELWEMATECPVVFPEGVGVVKWMVPGGKPIAVVTSQLMKKYNVAIWAHHGIFCSGEDFDLTFGLAHTVEKSAEILVKVLSIRPDKLQTITTENFKDLALDFNVRLSEEII
ncbi:MAG: rhamnulose-1-phosphate aldolase [Terrisporobacter sp.]|uniref:rhamnulose-1-phosphate aldolase n=1 Tax=Clostridia TaxID=186801 RepID=UPI002FC5D8B8